MGRPRLLAINLLMGAIKHQNRLACLRVAASAKAGRGHCKSLGAEPFEWQALRSTNFAGVTFGEVLNAPFHSNKTRITRVHLPSGKQGRVPAGAA